jgi:hypothetical protein
LVGVAVKVRDVPEQTLVPLPEAIDTEGVRVLFTVMATVLEVAVKGEAQGALEVITTDTISPFAGV